VVEVRTLADRRAELRAEIFAAHDELLHMIDSLSTNDWEQTTYEGWSSKDTFAHLASIQERQRAQVQAALDSAPWNPPEDVNAYNARKVEERRGWNTDQVRAEYEREQASTLAVLDRIREEDLQRTFQHPTRGTLTVESVFVQVATHTRNHAHDIVAVRSGSAT
jgi:DinB superfamily